MAKANTFKCPACGGRVEFDSATQQMKCPYCDTTYPVDYFSDSSTASSGSDAAAAQSSAAAASPVTPTVPAASPEASDSYYSGADSGDFAVYHCASCGAEVISDPSTAATHCPYCDNVIIMTGNLSGVRRPDYLIPFKYSREQAKQAMRDHFKDKTLLPRVFSEEAHLDEIKGIYVPFWLFTTTADGDADYKMTQVRTWSDLHYNYTETKHFRAERSGYVNFENIPIDALESIPNEVTESLEAFDFKEAVPFDTAYLSGYFANVFDVGADDCVDRIKERVGASASDSFRSTVTGYATVSLESSRIHLRDTSIKYAMYPVWILNTTWRGKKYLFAMNGQSGKFVGNLPIDKTKYLLMRLGWTAGIAAAGYALVTAVQAML